MSETWTAVHSLPRAVELHFMRAGAALHDIESAGISQRVG
jgi:hypothetical protein